jgi:hypothetical protein
MLLDSTGTQKARSFGSISFVAAMRLVCVSAAQLLAPFVFF